MLVVGQSRIVSRELGGLSVLLDRLRLTAGSVIGRFDLLFLRLWWMGQGTLKMTVLLLLLLL